jgi:uncharacterized protein (TIGR02284 family)
MAIALSQVGRYSYMNNHEVILIITDLVETCTDGQECFRNAAEKISNSEFRRLFAIFAQQRAQFVSELQAEVHRLGGDADKPTKHGPLHRTWINLKSAVPRDEASIIAECQREEEAAVNDYQEALKSDLPLDIQYVVKRQYMDIKDAYDRIRILQRAA